MARVQCSTQAWGWIADASGNAQAYVPVVIRDLSNAVVPIWDAVSGGAPISAPIVTNTSGAIPGWIEEGTYTITVAGVTNSIEAVSGVAVDTSALVLNTDPRLADARTPLAHTHPQTDVTGLTAALAAKQDAATATTDAELATAITPTWHPYPWEVGNYYTAYGSTTTGVPAEAQAEFAPIWIPVGARFDQIMIEVASTPDATETCRVGLYSADAFGKPGALLIEAGEVTLTTNGQKIIDFTVAPFSFPGPGLYWTCAVLQGASAVRPTMRRKNSAMFPNNFLTVSFASSTTVAGYTQPGVTGALPATAAVVSNVAAAMIVTMRAV